jgi:hypothetical protein
VGQDPYRPPKSDLEGAREHEVVRGDLKMPGTVIAAIVMVSVLMVLELYGLVREGGTQAVISVPISLLILWGLWRGHALAWQWGIVIPILLAIMVGLGLIALLGDSRVLGAAAWIGAVVPLLLYISIPVLLRFRRSRVFFGLECPRCQAVKTRAASFLFTQRRCRACGLEWTPVRRK